MELAPFAEDNFDPKDWINDVFKEQDKIDQHAATLVMKLQLAIQEVNTNLEDTSQQVLGSLPRVVRDVESLGSDATLLKTQMATLITEVKKVSLREGSDSLDTLVQLDAVKTRLTQSAQALRQADNWTTLVTEAEEVLEAGDLEAAADKVVQLQRCLSVLCHTPDSEDRAALLNSFQLRIEAMASPHVVDAFTHANLEESIKYSRILGLVGRGGQVRGYYHQCLLARLAAVWQAQVNRDAGTVAGLAGYYDNLAQLLHTQLGWVTEVFPSEDPRLLLAQSAVAALTDVDPPLHQVVASGAKLHEEPLQLLANVKGAMDDLLRHLQRTLAGEAGDELLQAAHVALTCAVYSPLAHQLTHYAGYEAATLSGHLAVADVMRPDVSESMLRLRDYCAKMRQQCTVAVDRCTQLTGLAGCHGLVEGVSGYVSAVTALLVSVRRSVAALDIQHDWTVFTTCLDLIHTAGVVLQGAEDCDEILTAAVGGLELQHAPPPFVLSPALLLRDMQQLRQFVNANKDSGGGMLESSLGAVRGECSACVSAALSTISAPLKAHLAPLPHLPVWSTHHPTSVLSAAFSPQEYVTQMGQYLLTLPQHLEPLLVSPSPALNRALQQLPVPDLSPGQRAVSESEVSAADFLIGRVAHTTCTLYTDAVLRIPALRGHAGDQLVTDVEYILNILEDLGVGSAAPLDQVLALLRAAPQDYSAVSETLTGVPIRMVAAVRQIRDIQAQT